MVVLANAGDGRSPHAAPVDQTQQQEQQQQRNAETSRVQSNLTASPVAKAKKCVNIANPPENTPIIAGPVVTGGTEERAPSRVRVHFFESGAVKCPSATGGSSAAMDVSVDGQLFNGNASNSYFRETQQTQQHVFTTSTPNGTSVRTVTYTARQSTDSGIDNPFRPEGELSLEADEIVKAIKEGRPIDSIDSGRISRQELGTTTLSINTSAVPENKSPTNVKNGAAKNGSAKGPSNKKDAKPGVVDVQRGVVVPPSEAQQAEQVVIKKKPRCKCCVIQ